MLAWHGCVWLPSTLLSDYSFVAKISGRRSVSPDQRELNEYDFLHLNEVQVVFDLAWARASGSSDETFFSCVSFVVFLFYEGSVFAHVQ